MGSYFRVRLQPNRAPLVRCQPVPVPLVRIAATRVLGELRAADLVFDPTLACGRSCGRAPAAPATTMPAPCGTARGPRRPLSERHRGSVARRAGLTPKPHHARQPRVALRGSFRLRLASTCNHRPARSSRHKVYARDLGRKGGRPRVHGVAIGASHDGNTSDGRAQPAPPRGPARWALRALRSGRPARAWLSERPLRAGISSPRAREWVLGRCPRSRPGAVRRSRR
jgi:hypothetical protein